MTRALADFADVLRRAQAWLLAARAVQGAGGAIVAPTALALIGVLALASDGLQRVFEVLLAAGSILGPRRDAVGAGRRRRLARATGCVPPSPPNRAIASSSPPTTSTPARASSDAAAPGSHAFNATEVRRVLPPSFGTE
jgi:hypothetical protein